MFIMQLGLFEENRYTNGSQIQFTPEVAGLIYRKKILEVGG